MMKRVSILALALFFASGANAFADNLADTEWRAVDVAVEQSLSFEKGRRFLGFTGCNRVFGSYRLAGEVIAMNTFGLTRKFCGEETGRHEAAFLDALKSVRYAIRDNGRLIFQDKSEKPLILFSRSR